MHAPSESQSAPAALQDVLLTDELARRTARAPDHQAENAALAGLAETVASRPADLLQQLADAALQLCRADSAGVSLLEPDDQFCWAAVAGAFAANAGGRIACSASPCGETIARDAPLLFRRPELHYRCPVAVDQPMEEALLVPFHQDGRPVGTLWVIAHTVDRHFDAEDARALARLSRFAPAGLQLQAAMQAEREARLQVQQQVAERTAQARAAQDFAESVVDTVRDPLLVLDAELRVVSASRAFYATFQVAPDETTGRRLFDLGNGQWDIPALHTLLEDILPRHTSFRDFEVVHDFAQIGRRSMLLNARRLQQAATAAGMVLLVIEDVTARREAEQARHEAEARFTEMVKNVRDHAIFLTDADGRVTAWNIAAERVFGYTEAEALGQHFSLIFTPEDVAAGAPAHELDQARTRGRAEDERWHLRKGGTRFWAFGTVTPRFDDQGRLAGFSKILRDMSERQHAQEALRASEERLQLALEAARMGTWSWDVGIDRHRRDANLNLLLGLPAVQTELPIDGFFDRLHPDDRALLRQAFDRSVQTGQHLRCDFRVVWPDGSVRWLSDRGDVFGSGPGRYLAGACVDITERKALEAQLRDADRRKDEFLAMLGHELRNPLAPLRNALDSLQRQALDLPQQIRAYAMMDRQVGHLTRLVNDLLDVSRITLGLIELHRGPVHMAAVAEQAVEMAAPVVEARGHELTLSMSRKPLVVQGDAARLTQVVYNLLNNAAKYTAPGGRLWLTLEREDGQVVVRVRDNGAGMSADLVPRVFDLFTQGTQTLDRAQGGLGLGLTLVKRLVQMHGGSASASSAGPGQGSEFVVRLPEAPAGQDGVPAIPAAAPPAAVVEGRALIIDDVPDIADSCAWLLDGLVRHVQVAYSGAQGIEMARQQPPDLVLCDLGMPGMDGHETCRQLRRLPGLAHTLIAAVSGYGGGESLRASQAAGFDRHLVKPVGLAALEDLVRSVALRSAPA